MATWTYEATWNESQNRGIPKEKSSVSFTLKRTSPASVDTSLYKLSSTSGTFSTDSSVRTYKTGGFALNFGGYGTSSTIAKNESTHAISGSVTGLSSNILNVGTGGTNISVSVKDVSTDTFNYIFFYGTKFTFTVEVTDKYSASSISASSVNIGSNSTVSFSNPYLSDLSHSVTWAINSSYTHTENDTAAGVSSATWQIPNSWLSAVPYATSTSCTITVVTKKGSSVIGTTSTTITLGVPESIKPTITSVTAAVLNPVSGFSGKYIQNKTGVTITASGVSAGTGSTISSNDFTIRMTKEENYTKDFANYRFTINTLRNSGSITFYVSVKDGRGRSSGEVSCTISVYAYSEPSIVSTTAYRCNASGIASETGTYAKIAITASYAAIQGNSMTINSKYYVSTNPSAKTTAVNNMTSGTEYRIGGSLSTSSTYYVEFTVTDTVGSSITLSVMIQTASYSIHVKNGGAGVAFGKTSERNNAVEINQGWDLYYKGNVVSPVIFSTTEPTAPTYTLTVGLVWLKPVS